MIFQGWNVPYSLTHLQGPPSPKGLGSCLAGKTMANVIRTYSLGASTPACPTLSFLLPHLCPRRMYFTAPFFFVSLKTFSASFKIQHKYISMKHSLVPPGKAACSLFLLTGRAFYMLEFVYLRHSIDYWRYLSILLAWKRTAQGKTGVWLIFVSPEASTEIDR